MHEKMKGLTKGMAAWILIVISVALGLIVLVFGTTFLLRQAEVGQKQVILEQYSDLGRKMKLTCEGGIGQTLYFAIAIPQNTRAIYVANMSDETPPDKVSEYITKTRSRVGNYFCLQFFDENIPRCDMTGCDMNFPYIGPPSLQSTLQNLVSVLSGNPPISKFYLKINKTDYKMLYTVAVPYVGDTLPAIS